MKVNLKYISKVHNNYIIDINSKIFKIKKAYFSKEELVCFCKVGKHLIKLDIFYYAPAYLTYTSFWLGSAIPYGFNGNISNAEVRNVRSYGALSHDYFGNGAVLGVRTVIVVAD